jgi:L-aspartate oxidase
MLDTMRSSAPAATDDVIIVGGGLAGLFCALRLAPRPVTVLATAPIGEGASSSWAHGGIAAAMSEGDSVEKHLADTLAAGAGIVDEKIARLMVGDASARVHDLLDYGVPFDQDLAGHLLMSREAAHSERRVVHVRGDMAGAAIMAALVEAVRKTPSIRILDGYVGERLQTAGRTVTGIVARPRVGGPAVLFPARAVILATGGIGHLYAVTTNPPESEGGGIGMAARAGAVIADPEFVQFHPTALNVGRDPAPLASEALRGEGATLINAAGERFMVAVHPLAELAPRDIVARAIHAEIAAGRGAFLDCRTAIGADFAEKFPTVYRSCREAGIDPVSEPIPVAPAEHFHMGGILTDANGRSTLDGLWACGETSSTGAHGANRLASNSLLEAVVFGARVAADIDQHFPVPMLMHPVGQPGDAQAAEPPAADVAELRRTMSADVGVVRDAAGLRRALAVIAGLAARNRSPRFANMLDAARLVAAAALLRTESRGGHYRSDYPEPEPGWRHRTYLTLAGAKAAAVPAAPEPAAAAT